MSAAVVYRLLAVLLLAGAGIHRYAVMRRPAGVEEYHRRVREAAAAIPRHIDGWVGEDTPVPAQAIRVLDPNVIISRRYLNVETGVGAGVLFVHCSDAHDMAGHFPVRCYRARGWEVRGVRPLDWAAGDLALSGYEYEFAAEWLEGRKVEAATVVANCLFRPGLVLRDMDAMNRSVVGVGGQASGAAQIQIYFDQDVSQAQREAAVTALARGYRPLIDAVLAGPAGE